MLKKIIYSTLLFLSIFITIPQEWLSYFKDEQEKISFLNNEPTIITSLPNPRRTIYNFKDINSHGGGSEMSRIFAVRYPSISSGMPSTTPLSVGVSLNPYTESLNRATLLPVENLWSLYATIDQSEDINNNKKTS